MAGEERKNQRHAVATDWKTVPMPERRGRVEYQRSFSSRDWAAIRRGLVPVEMEDRWFIYAADDWLYMHRSWTGYCIYQVRVEDTSDGGAITEVWVNADAGQFTGEFSEAEFSSLIDHILLPDAGGDSPP